MTSERRHGGCPAEGAELLGRALSYALCSARSVTPALLTRRTPCDGWDLGMLLRHANDSLAALQEATETGEMDMWPSAEPLATRQDPAAAFRAGASRLLATVGGGDRTSVVTVSGLPLAAAVVARTGALELAVHGWDIARSTGLPRPIPAALAVELLRTAREVVPLTARRRPLFAPPVPLPAHADPSDRLIAYLGRAPNV
jgi:uncharacterized protein (TIGR03086 family)